ncbi:hypothetical protein GY45DRAFT_174698 [Cubamyces sp. BRFM 1775]|nr:hypothetical protein GY45DRAFT_174698 [Cubamyces sp. BRFM 1775]
MIPLAARVYSVSSLLPSSGCLRTSERVALAARCIPNCGRPPSRAQDGALTLMKTFAVHMAVFRAKGFVAQSKPLSAHGRAIGRQFAKTICSPLMLIAVLVRVGVS